jgi:hypothetical protein
MLNRLKEINIAESFYEMYMNSLTMNLIQCTNSETLKKALDLTEAELREGVSKGFNKMKDTLPFSASEKQILEINEEMMEIARKEIMKTYININE